MIQDFDWQQWNHIPRLAMSVAEVGYNRYQVRLQTSFDEGAVTRLTTLSSILRDEISNSFREPYSEPEPTTWHRIGGHLYDTFLPGTLGEMLQDAQAVYRRESSIAEEDPAPLRLRVEIRDALLHYLPWEFLHDPGQVIGSPMAPLIVTRYTPPSVPPAPLPFNWPLKVLVVIASPAIKGGLDPYYEMDVLHDALDGAPVELSLEENPTRDQLADLLAHRRPHVLHYIGHGYVSRGNGYLAFRRPQGSLSDFVSPTDLGGMISPGPLRLIGLQSPSSTPNYQLSAFAGFAAEIAAVGVAGISFSLLPQSTDAFGGLYARLADGMAVDQALQSGRSDTVPPRVGFHLHAATSQILVDPHRGEVRIAPSSDVLPRIQAAVEQAAQEAPSARKAKAIRQAGNSVLEYLEKGVEQLVLSPGLSTVLKASWENLESVTEGVTGRSIQALMEADDWEWAEIRQGGRPPCETHLAELTSQRIDEIDFVRHSLSRLHGIEREYGGETPDWLQGEIGSYRERLTTLVGDVKGG